MFAAGTSAKSKAINAIALLTIVTVGVVLAMLLIKLKPDPKEPTTLRGHLPFGKSNKQG